MRKLVSLQISSGMFEMRLYCNKRASSAVKFDTVLGNICSNLLSLSERVRRRERPPNNSSLSAADKSNMESSSKDNILLLLISKTSKAVRL